jgi:copper chaperone NosL
LRALTGLLLALLFGSGALAAPPPFTKPGPKDKCPVCGMFVAPYASWAAQIVFRDGARLSFDGAKDLFKYLFDMKKYGGKRSETEVEAVYVTDYYDVRAVDAKQAFYVIGSDVYGPMGKELIPFEREADAGVFLQDHRGKRILRYPEVKRALPELGD